MSLAFSSEVVIMLESDMMCWPIAMESSTIPFDTSPSGLEFPWPTSLSSLCDCHLLYLALLAVDVQTLAGCRDLCVPFLE